MIQLAPQVRILVATEPADFRKGIDGLGRLARKQLSQDPFSGTILVFRNRRCTAVKILVYDGQGFWLLYKRLSSGRFRFWPQLRARQPVATLAPEQLYVLLRAGDYRAAGGAPVWRRIEG